MNTEAHQELQRPKNSLFITLEKPNVFKRFWVQRPPKRASRGPRRLPRGTQRAPKPQKRDPKLDPKINNFLTNFGVILGPRMGLQKGTKNGTTFGIPFPRISGVQITPRQKLNERVKSLLELELYSPKEREG